MKPPKTTDLALASALFHTTAPNDIALSDATRYRDALAAVRRTLRADNSVRVYFHAWSSWTEHRAGQVLNATAADVYGYAQGLAARGLAKKTIAQALTILRQFYAALVVQGLLPTNPAREVRTPRVDRAKNTPWLPTEDLAKFLSAFDGDDSWSGRRGRLILLCLAGLGLRRVEVAKLTWGMIKKTPAGMSITTIVKGGKEVTIGVPAVLEKEILLWYAAWRHWLLNYASPVGSLWTKDGHIPSDDLIYATVKEAAMRCGLPPERCTPHALRRTLATLAKLSGTSLDDIQKALGHTRASTTEEYLQDSRLPSRPVGDDVLKNALKSDT